MYTHEQLLRAVHEAGRDGKTFSIKDVRMQLGFETRDKRELSRFRRRLRAFEKAAANELEKLGNNSYRLKPSALEVCPPAVAEPRHGTEMEMEMGMGMGMGMEMGVALASAPVEPEAPSPANEPLNNVVPFPGKHRDHRDIDTASQTPSPAPSQTQEPIVPLEADAPAATSAPDESHTALQAPAAAFAGAEPQAPFAAVTEPEPHAPRAAFAETKLQTPSAAPAEAEPQTPRAGPRDAAVQAPTPASGASEMGSNRPQRRPTKGIATALAARMFATGAAVSSRMRERRNGLRQQLVACLHGEPSRRRRFFSVRRWATELRPFSARVRERLSAQLHSLRQRVGSRRTTA